MSARIDEKNEMITFVTDELDYANIVNELNDQNQRVLRLYIYIYIYNMVDSGSNGEGEDHRFRHKNL